MGSKQKDIEEKTTAPKKQHRLAKRTIAAATVMIILLGVAVWFFWPTLSSFLPGADTRDDSSDRVVREMTEEEKLEALLVDDIQALKIAVNSDEGDLDAISASAAAAKAAITAIDTSSLSSSGKDCEAIAQFSETNVKAAAAKKQAAIKDYRRANELILAKWKVWDSATTHSRASAESLFADKLTSLENTRGLNSDQVAALTSYRNGMLQTFTLFYDDYDATQAMYRHDFLELLETYQSLLAVQTEQFINAIKATASSCSENAQQASSSIIQAKSRYIAGVVNETDEANVKAREILRDRERLLEDYMKVALKKADSLRDKLRNISLQ